MVSSKSWHHSRTIWAALVTILTSIAGLVGLPVGTLDQASLVDTILQAVTAISGIIAILGRVSASQRIE
ncbi:hypothetical protein [Mesorhizobium xinjiangense]|uniref:hypothetical protein n=1 Tax=Mesorhizobium xinjiangense TaxID=2678685 RepID=UPI0012EDE338|nr:hypothetical protein [Mesorhizobium xinjiangense]